MSTIGRIAQSLGGVVRLTNRSGPSRPASPAHTPEQRRPKLLESIIVTFVKGEIGPVSWLKRSQRTVWLPATVPPSSANSRQ